MSYHSGVQNSKWLGKHQIDIRNYKIIGTISRGGFSSIYSCEEIRTQQKYAAKVVSYTKDDDERKQMINREIEIMAYLNHPTIIKFHGYSLKDFDGNSRVVIMMDFAIKGSLGKILNDVKNSTADHDYDNTARQIILVGIARGMMLLHQLKIIHRDLKPDNILIDENFHPHITDFGLSKKFEPGHSLEQSKICGTTIYMAPEVISDKDYDIKSDVYSFGILMYEILTDLPPYPAFMEHKMTNYDFNNKVVNNDLRPEFTVPVKESLKKLAESCWSAIPDERPSFEEIFYKLAYNTEMESFDIFDQSQSVKTNSHDYYLEDVDIDALLSYVDEIAIIDPRENNDSYKSGSKYIKQKISKMKKDLKALEAKNEQLKIDHENKIKKNEEALESEINPLKEDNKNILKRLKKIEKAMKDDTKKLQRNLELLDDEDDEASPLTVDEFNNLSIRKQQEAIKEIIDFTPTPKKSDEKKPNAKKEVSIFIKISNLLQFLLKFNPIEAIKYVEIKSLDANDKLSSLNEVDQGLIRVHLLYNTTEILFRYQMLHSPDFINYLYQFQIASIEIKYPLDTYEAMNNIVSFIKRAQPNRIKIAIFISGINETDSKFQHDTNINILTFDNTVKLIDANSFKGCKSLEELMIPLSVTEIKRSAFYECSSLKKIVISPSVSSIGDEAFYECTSIKQLIIPSSVENIGNDAFARCSALEELTIDPFFTNIKSDTFNLCSIKHLIIGTAAQKIKQLDYRKFGFNAENRDEMYNTKLHNSCNSRNCSSDSNVELYDDVPKRRYVNRIRSNNQRNFDDENENAHDEILQIPVERDIDVEEEEECNEIKLTISPSFVTSIGPKAFYNFSMITNIQIPDSVTLIEKYAFEGCSSLKKIEIPSSVTSIECYIFKGCSSLKEIEIPNSINTLPEGCFLSCSSLTKPTIPNSVTSIESYSFKGCSSLKEIEIPGSIKTIPESCFFECSSLTKATFPNSVTSIESYSFKGCSSLKEIVDLSSLTNIDTEAFCGCSALEQISISTVKKIESKAFKDCSSLVEIEIPSSISSIENETFSGCSSLKEIKIPETVSSIKDDAFIGCSSIKKLVIPSSVTDIGYESFSKCSSLVQVTIDPFSTQIQKDTFYDCPSFRHIIIGNTVKTLKKFDYERFNGHFQNRLFDKQLNMNDNEEEDDEEYEASWNSVNDSVDKNLSDSNLVNSKVQYNKRISNSFSDDSHAKQEQNFPSKSKINVDLNDSNVEEDDDEINVDLNDSNVEEDDERNADLNNSNANEVFSTSFDYENDDFSSKSETKIPKSVNSKKKHSSSDNVPEVNHVYNEEYESDDNENFSRENSLTKKENNIEVEIELEYSEKSSIAEQSNDIVITIPDSVTTIDERAFEYCSCFDIIELPKGIKSIKDEVFSGCKSLKCIQIPSSVTSIGEKSFYNCTQLTNVIIPDSVESIGEQSFDGCSSLKEIIIKALIKTIPEGCCNNCRGLENITLPPSLTSIESNAFQNCSSLKQVSIPSNIKEIKPYSFAGCSSLIQISIPSSVKLIGSHAFDGCSKLDQISLPSSVTEINEYLFSSCTSLKEIKISSKVTYIGEGAFSECSSLTEFKLPSSITKINEKVFRNCKNLKGINIHSSINAIAESSFYSCSSFKELVIPETVIKIGSEAFSQCSSLEKITINPFVTKIEDDAFSYCPSIKHLIVDTKAASISEFDYSIFDGLFRPQTYQMKCRRSVKPRSTKNRIQRELSDEPE